MRKGNKLVDWYFSKNALPYWVVLFMDCLIIFVSGILMFWLFYRGVVLHGNILPVSRTLILYIVLCLIPFRINHTYSGIIRYSSFVDLQRIGVAMIEGLFLCWVANIVILANPGRIFVHFPHMLLLLTFIFATALMWAMRIIVKMVYDILYGTEEAKNALVYGVLDEAVGLAKSVRNEKPAKFEVKGFISHDPRLTFTHLLGEKVYQVNEDLPKVLKKKEIGAVLISPKRNDAFREDTVLQDYIISSGAKIYMVRGATEWDRDTDEDRKLKEVRIEDLLPRDQISVDMESIGNVLRGTRIMITGSAGSIGAEIVRQIAKFAPKAMMLVDQAESPQHDIRVMMAKDFPDIETSIVVTSIVHPHRMEKIFRDFRPDYVFHAAAYKHVPMMEDNAPEAILNNVYGTKVIADLSVRYGVRKFVMISTDKAVNPTNVMGCSKRICEIYVQSLNRAEEMGKVDGKTQFVTTRFGNVLGSNGSVIPLFEEQIKAGGPVTVTDPNIIRYFMLIPEACKLVLEAGTKGHGGEILVFDMGKPIKIDDLARRMISLSGAKNIEIKYTGLREGEKLYEEVLSDKEKTKPSFHEKVRVAEVREYDYDSVSRQIDELLEIARGYDDMATVAKMKEIVPEFISNNSIYSVLDRK